VNGHLESDHGGTHSVESGTLDFTTMPGINLCDTVTIDVFYAERHAPWATFNISTNIDFANTACNAVTTTTVSAATTTADSVSATTTADSVSATTAAVSVDTTVSVGITAAVTIGDSATTGSGSIGSGSTTGSGSTGAGSTGAGFGGDPHFKGMNGDKYDIDGVPDTWFNIISDVNFQMNGYTVRSCPNMNSTFFGSFAMLVGGHKIHIEVTCNATLDGTTSLLEIGSVFRIGDSGYIQHASPQVYIVETTDYHVRINPFIVDPAYHSKYFKGPDCIKGYFNVEAILKNTERKPHGLLGQTAHLVHTATPKGNQGQGEIEGVYTDYIVSSMYALDDKFNRYTIDDSVAPFTAYVPKGYHYDFVPNGEYQTLIKFMEDQCAAK